MDTTTPNAQNVLIPVSITGGFSATAPAAGAVTELALAIGTSTSDTLSSPFVDYTNDWPISVTTLACCSASFMSFAQSGLHEWGVSSTEPGWQLGIEWRAHDRRTCTGKLTGAVVDGGTGNIFVGCSDGKLYGFTPAGAAIAGSPLTVGAGSGTGGIVDPPMIDAVNGFRLCRERKRRRNLSSHGPSQHDKL